MHYYQMVGSGIYQAESGAAPNATRLDLNGTTILCEAVNALVASPSKFEIEKFCGDSFPQIADKISIECKSQIDHCVVRFEGVTSLNQLPNLCG